MEAALLGDVTKPYRVADWPDDDEVLPVVAEGLRHQRFELWKRDGRFTKLSGTSAVAVSVVREAQAVRVVNVLTSFACHGRMCSGGRRHVAEMTTSTEQLISPSRGPSQG